MSPPAKKPRTRKSPKESNANSSRQTSLLDAFSKKSSAKKTLTSTSAPVSENGSLGGDDVIDILSSEPDPSPEQLPEGSSSPITIDDEPEVSVESSGNSRMLYGLTDTVGGSRDVPIVIPDSSPAASPVVPSRVALVSLPPPPPKALYSIFAPRKEAKSRAESPQTTYGKHSTRPPAPFPDSSSQHVRGPQTTWHVPLSSLSLRQPATRVSDEELDATVYSRLAQSTVADEYRQSISLGIVESPDATRQRVLQGIPPNHMSYPAISRFLHIPPSSSAPEALIDSCSLWNDKWRPKRADEVLGNEQSALYLRDWLLALKLHIHGTDQAPAAGPADVDKKGKPKSTKSKRAKAPRGVKRPRIVRDVERKRRRIDSEEPEDAWIAADDSDGDDPLDIIGLPQSEDDFLQPHVSRLRHSQNEDGEDSGIDTTDDASGPSPSTDTDNIPLFSYSPPKFGDTIYNTILLVGPSGCGKTASVHACAEELGWDVFEVYPGVGERSGAALQKLIGEVGKNHMVRQTQQQPKTEKNKSHDRAKKNFFGRRVVSDDEDYAEKGLVTSQDHEESQGITEPVKLDPVVSQSIVLVEEVDILYRGDTNFWQTMIKIIKECRRPVVMTCNDISLVPLGDLPLQCVLEFAPCPGPLATSYLQLLCLSESRMLERDQAASVHENSTTVVVDRGHDQDAFFYPRGGPQSLPDLRFTINQLQYGAYSTGPCASSVVQMEDQSLKALRNLGRVCDLASLLDSGLRRPQDEVLRELMDDSLSPCQDDVAGFKHLVNKTGDFPSHLPVTFTIYDRDEEIYDDLHISTSLHYPSPQHPGADVDLPALWTPHYASLIPILDSMWISRDQLVRDPSSIILDYEPWIRFMNRVDQERIAAYRAIARTDSSTRQTRNSQRSNLADTIWLNSLNDAQREALGRTAFDLHVDSDGPTDTGPLMSM